MKLNTNAWRLYPFNCLFWSCLLLSRLCGMICYVFIDCFRPASFVFNLKEFKIKFQINILPSTHIHIQPSFLLIQLSLVEKERIPDLSNCIRLPVQVCLELILVRPTFCPQLREPWKIGAYKRMSCLYDWNVLLTWSQGVLVILSICWYLFLFSWACQIKFWIYW